MKILSKCMNAIGFMSFASVQQYIWTTNVGIKNIYAINICIKYYDLRQIINTYVRDNCCYARKGYHVKHPVRGITICFDIWYL